MSTTRWMARAVRERAEKVPCPTCGAPAGKRCTHQGAPTTVPHTARQDAARAEA